MAKSDGTSNNGFLMIRRGLFDHIETGLMKGRDIPTYVAIHFFADYETGVAYNISAPFMGKFLHQKPHVVRRSLRRLEARGYIKRFAQRGGHPGYDIVIDKYLVKKCISIDAGKSKSINEIAFTVKQDCTLSVNRLNIECTSSEHRVLPIKDIKMVEIKKCGGKKPHTPSSFTSPKVEEVKEYATSIDYPEIDAEHFVEKYTAAEWKHKDGKPMRSWKQTVVTWKKNDKGRQERQTTQHDGPNQAKHYQGEYGFRTST